MNRLERFAISIRHAPGLESASWLWSRVAPAYDLVLSAFTSERGLERVINGTDTIRLSPRSRAFVTETYEPAVWDRLMNEIRAGDRIAEIGANIGLYALAMAARIGAMGRVFAFEPDPENAAALEANVTVNQFRERITIVRAAVGAASGTVRFAAALASEAHVLADGETVPSAIEVPIVALDRVFHDGRIDLLKIDVEGFEEPVLRGAHELLRDRVRRPRMILIEVHPFAWQSVGTSSESLIAELEGVGYRIETVAGETVSLISEYGHIVAVPRPN
jgi:FkbM family methyltransferase